MTRWIPDASLDAPDGHTWMRPAPDDCARCDCHTARVCEGFQWHLATLPTQPDGTQYTEPCPCEEKARQPEDRTVAIELDGILRHLPAKLHRTGLLAGRLVTDRLFRAQSAMAGECPVPVPMGLHHPTEQTDPRLIVIDSTGQKWVMGFTAQHNLQRYRITGFARVP
ncbi:hypothetical protein AB0G79_20255 [Streptomyces sp. NPDC020807]|uniref:hypothetical protein n=1 Tax=Streptomyces sp. NPDC020807 TaxID=3155119 RepID=UPI0033CB36D2